MNDLVKRLRQTKSVWIVVDGYNQTEWMGVDSDIAKEAADRIEELERALADAEPCRTPNCPLYQTVE